VNFELWYFVLYAASVPPPIIQKTQRSKSVDLSVLATHKPPVRPPVSGQSNGGFHLSLPPQPPSQTLQPAASTARRNTTVNERNTLKALPLPPTSTVNSSGSYKAPPPPPPTKNKAHSHAGDSFRQSHSTPSFQPSPPPPPPAPRPMAQMNGHVSPASGGVGGPQFRLPTAAFPRVGGASSEFSKPSAAGFPPTPPSPASKYNGPVAPRPPSVGTTPPPVPPPVKRPSAQMRPSTPPGPPPVMPQTRSAPTIGTGGAPPVPPATKPVMRCPPGPPPVLPPSRAQRPPNNGPTPLRLPNGPPPPLPPPRMASKFR